ncbi:ATP-binding protein [Nonomuraea antimicrobica]|uniref:ATP-binding protein n=1 Tax=Nonomuraea antimicrobica TaxID=561173 RepID=A0ABP7CN06_9ACTN
MWAALADTQVVVVNGARQVGKSTLARLIADQADNARQLYLDDPAILAAAEEDPVSFLRHDGLLLIDEIQRAPRLLLPIKHEVDKDPRAGRYLLTGSARLLGLRDLPDALPGRTETIELWPLSQGEIDNAPDGFVDHVLTHETSTPPCAPALSVSMTTSTEPCVAATRRRSGESLAADATGSSTRTSPTITRDVRQISDIERPAEMRRLLSIVAARMGGLAVAQSIAGDVGLPRMTLSRYLDLLELVFVIKRIPAWSSNLTRRAISTPKLLVTDTGLRGRLISMSPERARDVTAPIGPLLENFAIGEIARQLTWANEPVQLFHYRDRDKVEVEVDIILEHASGEVIGIEIKAAETVRSDDFRGLRHLADRLGSRFRAGFVLYTGEQPLAFGEHLRALPMASLWTTGGTTEV